jgi:hypothetical protein
MQASARWSALEQGTPYSPRESRSRAAAARRARAVTLTAVAAVLLGWFLESSVRASVDSATRRALLAKEACVPLHGWLPAVVVLDAVGAPSLLLAPRYDRDDAATDLVRVKEKSELCPLTRSVIRQKRVNVTHGFFRLRKSAFEGKTGACVMHLADALRQRSCVS